MKSFVVLIFIVGTALCAPDTRARRDILPGDPRYGTDYHKHHHHHEGGNGGNAGYNFQIVKSVGKYAGTLSGSGPSSSGGAPFSAAGSSNYQPTTLVRQASRQGTATHQSAPVQAPQPQLHYHVVQQASQRSPAIPAASYGIPQVNYSPQPQPQPNYVQQPIYQVPQQRPVPFQAYGPPAQQSSPSVNQPQQLPRPTPNRGYLGPVVEQGPVVHYQPQPQQQPSASVIHHAEHQPQPQPQVHYVYIENQPIQHVEHRHVEHHQQTQQTQQTQHVQQQVQQQVYNPVNSYGVPVKQSQPALEYIPQVIQESAPASQEQVTYHVVHDEPVEAVRTSNDQFFPGIPQTSNFPSGSNFLGGFNNIPSALSIPGFSGSSGQSSQPCEPSQEQAQTIQVNESPSKNKESSEVRSFSAVEQPQVTIQYLSPSSAPAAESVVVESASQSGSANSQLVDSNGGYVY